MGSSQEKEVEWLKCSGSFSYFVNNYVLIYDATIGEWIPFALWDEQEDAATLVDENQKVIILKARQLGLTWLCLAYILWKMIFRPITTALLFSRRDDEAKYLRKRLIGMYDRLPEWMQAKKVVSDNEHVFELSNGSVAYGFPTTAGDSYTASIVLVDEADLIPDLNALLGAVKPTIDGGGKIMLISRSDKDRPRSPFKEIFRAAVRGQNNWAYLFLPWFVRPGRDEAWYDDQKSDILTRTGALDDLYAQYPATPTEALAARSSSKRIPLEVVEDVFVEQAPLESHELDIPGIFVYQLPAPNGHYVIGADTAEGNTTSDPSALVVLDAITGEECASYAVPTDPAVLGAYSWAASTYYNNAPIMVERNNHGHAVILWLTENAPSVLLLLGLDDKVGWNTNTASKSIAYTHIVEDMKASDIVIHSPAVSDQLTSIDAATLKAPKGMHDDLAVAFVVANQGRRVPEAVTFVYQYNEV